MSIHACRECGDRVSSEASACPHCGVPNPAWVVEAHASGAAVAAPEQLTRTETPLWLRGLMMGAGLYAFRVWFQDYRFDAGEFVITVVGFMIVFPLVSKLFKFVFS